MKNTEKKGMSVKVRDNNINGAISALKKLLNEDGLKKELKKREYHMTRNQRRRKDKAAAIRRHKRNKMDQERGKNGAI